jgi:hypothetical protein
MKTNSFFFVVIALSAQSQPSVETFKQVLTQKLLSLPPEGMTERNVLFESAQGGRGGSFQAVVNIRDYGPGYPPNHFYGTTCVSRLAASFTMLAGDGGQWLLDGPLTPPLDTRKCQNNPSEGASAVPLSSVSGTPANGRAPAPPAGTSPPGSVALGSYECWANGQARLLMNFQIRSANGYIGSDGKPGTFTLDAAGNIAFHGGALDGVMPQGFTSHYYSPRGRPTVSFRGRSGGEAAFCEKVR